MPIVPISSRLHRTIKGVKQFDTRVTRESLQETGILSLLSAGEQILGVYWNKSDGKFFAVTDAALIVCQGNSPVRVQFDQMRSSHVVAAQKSISEEVKINLQNGMTIALLVDGGEGQFRDVFSVGRFVARVIEDHQGIAETSKPRQPGTMH